MQVVENPIERFPRAVIERLTYIDFRLYFLGDLRRADLMQRFGTGPAGATRDIALYRQFLPSNLELDPVTKTYCPTQSFVPMVLHSPAQVLTAISQGFGSGLADFSEPLLPCAFPTALSLPDADVLAPITRSIRHGKAVQLSYYSITSGPTVREIVPLALVDIGPRWHVRAYDRKSQEFRDFVFTRMRGITVLDGPTEPHERLAADDQWNRVVELVLVPHPQHPRPEAVMLDYRITDKPLKVKARAANVGYMLQQWRVDCSSDHRLPGVEFPLWLKDRLLLYGVSNANIAPGFGENGE